MEQWLNAPFTLRLKVFLFLFAGTGILLIAAIAFLSPMTGFCWF